MKVILFFILGFATSCANSNTSSSRLSEIKQAGILRVGTTGDYAPFSFYQNKELKGIDIALAKALSKSIGLNLKLVKTSWPTLSEDLKNRKFDIAMSGITIKDDRKKIGLFSFPYYKFGKLPIARCKEKNKYTSLKKIDSKNTRVIVNPGGTNYEFAFEKIKQAKIRVFQDNAKIFNEIAENRADIMMTDSIEVLYQSKLSKGILCPTMTTPLTQSEMGIFMPKDEKLRSQINDWLKKYKDSGKLEKLFSQWL